MTNPDIEQIARGLSEAQRKALAHRNAGGCSFSWTNIGTLEALCKRGLVRRCGGVGAFSSPQTAIKWPLTPLGLAVRKWIMENSDV